MILLIACTTEHTKNNQLSINYVIAWIIYLIIYSWSNVTQITDSCDFIR